MQALAQPDVWLLYRLMLRSRLFEEAVAELWRQGKISGEMHLGIGEEAIAAGIVQQLRDGDALALDHRGTPPMVVRGIDLDLLLREFLGRADGLCSGMGGHMHLFSREHLTASSGIVGASAPAAVGFALAAQHLRPRTVAVAFFGEGAMNQGALLESLNLAAAWKLPLLFVCKDSQLAITTDSSSVTGGNIIDRARGFALVAEEIDGRDVVSVWHSAHKALNRARSGMGPSFLLAQCVHPEGHFLDDPLLQFVRRPGRALRQRVPPLVRSAIARGAPSLRARLSSIKAVTDLIAGARKQTFKRDDPVHRTRQELIKEHKLRLQQVEKEEEKKMTEVVRRATVHVS